MKTHTLTFLDRAGDVFVWDKSSGKMVSVLDGKVALIDDPHRAADIRLNASIISESEARRMTSSLDLAMQALVHPYCGAEEIKVFISSRESRCSECGEKLGPDAWTTLTRERGALCLSCADLDHLVFLRSGNMALTKRARKHSRLSAVVLKWSRARKRYERQGLMIEHQALEKAEKECLSDGDIRELRRRREAIRREELDRRYLDQFAARIKELFPGCPNGREREIAEYACLKYSGRVGRSASAKKLDEAAIRLAVIAHLRHSETRYDELLSMGYDRWDARAAIEETIARVLQKWEVPS